MLAVEYRDCLLNEKKAGEAMAEMVLEKADTKNQFLRRQGISLPYPLKRVFCNTLTKSDYDFACCQFNA